MRLIIVLTALLVLAGTVCAKPYATATYTPLESGAYRLDFILHAGYGYGSLYSFSLPVTGVTDLAAPVGWRAGSDFRSTDWHSSRTEYDIPPGGTLTGCAGTFATLPAQLDYGVYVTMSPGGFYDTLIPTLVPEPSCVLPLAVGIAGLAGYAMRRRR